MVTALLRGDVDGARNLLDPVRQSPRQGGLLEYEAMAAAAASWIAYRTDDPVTVVEEGHSALEIWSSLPTRFVFDWMCCLPLLDVALEQGDLANAEIWAQAMLSAEQQPLPDSISENLRLGLQVIGSDERSTAEGRFYRAITEASDLGYV